jgi:hypothetical protein
VREEQSLYRDLPRYHSFGTPEERERFLMDHLQGIYADLEHSMALFSNESKA